MKKIQLISAAMLLLLAASSCTQELFSSKGDSTTSLEVTIDNTKTFLGYKDGNAWPNYWEAGDKINVNGLQSQPVDASYNGKTCATFNFDGVLEAPLCAAYPADAVSVYDSESAQIKLPASQNYMGGTYDSASFLMVGKSTGDASVSLSPQMAILHLTLNGTASIRKVKVIGAPTDALSGKFTTDYTSITPSDASNMVEVVTAVPVALPAEFFICVPAATYTSFTVDAYDTEGGMMSKTAKMNSAFAAGQAYSAPELTYVPTYGIIAYVDGITSSTAIVSWENAPDAAYTIDVYSDSGCSALVNSYAVPAGDDCWSGKSPRFCVSGLNPGTTYYAKVTNVTSGTSSPPAAFITKAFTNVQVSHTPAAVGDVILAEDFGELCWDCDMIGEGAGWFPTTEARTTSFTTVDVASYQAAATSNEKVLGSQAEALSVSRLSSWGQGANNNLYVHPGYVKLVGSSKVTHIVTPALDNIPAGKIATLEVEVTASAYYSESSSAFATTNAIVAVQTGDMNDLIGGNTNDLDLTSNKKDITLAEETSWNTYKVTLTGVKKGNSLAFGAAADVTKNNARMNLSDIKVTIKSLDEDSNYFQIYNTATLKNFITKVNGGDYSINAVVTSDFTVSNSDAAELDLLESYEGTFDGSDCTITGLIKPLFNTLYGTVKNLTLDSNINMSDDGFYGSGIFARTMGTYDGLAAPASLTGCTAKGSLTWDASGSIGDRAVGGLVGRVEGGIVSNCENKATITTKGSLKDDGSKKLGQLMLGGVMGRGLKDSHLNHGSDVSDCVNSGTVNFNGESTNAYIGGVSGYDVDSACSTTGCTNTGTVQIGGSGYANPVNLGGVVGLSSGAMSNNTNSGTVQTLWAGSNSPHVYIGGVVGRIGSTSQTFSNLVHSSTGSVVVSGKGYTMSVGGVVGWTKGGKATNWECAGNVTLDGGAYTVQVGGLAGNVGNRKYAKTEGDDGSKHLTFTNCTVANTATINTTADAFITSSSNANDNALSVGGMFGRVTEGVTVDGGSSAGTVNIVPVTMTTANQPWCIGGIIGYASVIGKAATTKGILLNNVVNTGSVTIADGSNTKYAANKVGGIVGWCRMFKDEAPLVLTDCVNKGTISIASAEAKSSYLGGIAGVLETTADKSEMKLVRCINGDSANAALGAISNAAGCGEADMILAGICSKIVGVEGMPITLEGCLNYGPVTNSGESTWKASAVASSSWGVLCAGIVGRTEGDCILSATSDSDINRNINYGTITDNSVSKSPCLGGIVGSAAGTIATNFQYCENRGTVQHTGASAQTIIAGGICGHTNGAPDLSHTTNYGDVKVLGNADSHTTSKYVLIAGVLGAANSSSTTYSIDYTTNNGKVTVTNYDLDESGQLYVSGVMGYIGHGNSQTFDHCTNNGDVVLLAVGNPVPSTSYQYVAGILSTNNGGKALTYCTNNGLIDAGNNNGSGNPYRLDLKARVGGIAGFLTVCPQYCTNTGNVHAVKKYNKDNNTGSQVGGIVGYMSVATLSNLTSTGSVYGAGGSPVASIGGIVGQTGETLTKVQNCTVGGYINGGSTTKGGLFIGNGATSNPDFENCFIKTGAKIQAKNEGSAASTKTFSTVGYSMTTSDWLVSNAYTVTSCTVIE